MLEARAQDRQGDAWGGLRKARPGRLEAKPRGRVRWGGPALGIAEPDADEAAVLEARAEDRAAYARDALKARPLRLTRRGTGRPQRPGGGSLLLQLVKHPDGTTGGPLHTVERSKWLAHRFGFDPRTAHPHVSAALSTVSEEDSRLAQVSERSVSTARINAAVLSGENSPWQRLREEAAMVKLTLSPADLAAMSVEELRAVRKLGIVSDWTLRQLIARKKTSIAFSGCSAVLPGAACLPSPSTVLVEARPPHPTSIRRSPSRGRVSQGSSSSSGKPPEVRCYI